MINRILGIAINDYDDFELNKINNCLNDLNEIISILTSRYLFDDIELISNKEQTTRKYLYNRLYDYFINSLEDENILLIYIGHGEYNESIKTSYWLPSDSVPNDQSSWLNINDLLNYIKSSKAFHINIISDSCFSGAIFETASRGGGTSALNNKKSRLALTSGSIEKVSDGLKGNLSPFTEKLCSILSNNTELELPFSMLSNKLIMSFDSDRSQTPMYGSLSNVGHEGGSLIFHLKDSSYNLESKPDFTEISLGLNIDMPIEINYECKIPMFSKNRLFDNMFVNAYIQQLAFNIISDTRSFLYEDKEYIIERNKEVEFDLDIDYSITLLNNIFLSLTLSVGSYFGGIHPNNHVYSLNIAFNPERKLTLYDLIKFDSFEEFIISNIEKYSNDEEQKGILLEYIEQITPYKIDFSFNDEFLTLYFLNHLPRVAMFFGYLSIPREDLEFKIR